MAKLKIAITLDEGAVEAVDRLVSERQFASRSQAIQAAVDEKLARILGSRLAVECAKLDPLFEHSLADEGIEAERATWPAY
ncbi:MAG: ribbon-helix-helix domain-containing protein [Coriobacteriia bacterium]|nr:ribbon-helix-helix domain-containing protein [Coriobacteriia bacterium]